MTINYGVIIPTHAALKLPKYTNDLLTRFANWGNKQFEPTKDEIIADRANDVWIQESSNLSYQRDKNLKFATNSTNYFNKNRNQVDNWMFGPALPLVIKDFNI